MSPPGPTSAKSERNFLRKQGEDAQAAIAHLAGEIKGDVRKAMDLRELVKAHPIATTGVAVAVGIAAGIVLTPGKRSETQVKSRREGPSAFSKIALELFNLVKPAIASALTGAVAAYTKQPNTPDQQQSE